MASVSTKVVIAPAVVHSVFCCHATLINTDTVRAVSHCCCVVLLFFSVFFFLLLVVVVAITGETAGVGIMFSLLVQLLPLLVLLLLKQLLLFLLLLQGLQDNEDLALDPTFRQRHCCENVFLAAQFVWFCEQLQQINSFCWCQLLMLAKLL